MSHVAEWCVDDRALRHRDYLRLPRGAGLILTGLGTATILLDIRIQEKATDPMSRGGTRLGLLNRDWAISDTITLEHCPRQTPTSGEFLKCFQEEWEALSWR